MLWVSSYIKLKPQLWCVTSLDVLFGFQSTRVIKMDNAKSLTDLVAERTELDKQIKTVRKTVRKTERRAAIKDIKKKMSLFNITLAELSKVSVTKTGKVKAKVAPKWKQPDGELTWTGRGKTPKWFDANTAIKL